MQDAQHFTHYIQWYAERTRRLHLDLGILSLLLSRRLSLSITTTVEFLREGTQLLYQQD